MVRIYFFIITPTSSCRLLWSREKANKMTRVAAIGFCQSIIPV